MVLLGISETHCATAALLVDGAVVGCASEERFSRLKNDAGYPRRAIDALLRELALAPAQIDHVVLAGTRIPSYAWMNRAMRDEAYVRQYYGVRLDAPRRGLAGRARRLGARLGLLDPAPGKAPLADAERRGLVTAHLGLDAGRVAIVDHHACHAAAAYLGSPFGGAPALVLTNDNSGDGLCATVSTGRGTAVERHEATRSGPGSLGSFYTLVTLLLGMKPGEHEYKVMGLAPYAPARQAERALAALRDVFDFAEGRPCRFEWRRRGPLYRALLDAPLGLRLDAIAGGPPPPPPRGRGGRGGAAHPRRPPRPARRRGRRRRPAAPGGGAGRVGAAHARAPRRRAPGTRRRRLHEREGEHAARGRGLGAGPLRVPLVQRRVQRGRCRVPRLPRPLRAAGGAARARALRPGGPRPRARRRAGRGRGPGPRPRGAVPGERARADRGADRRAAGLGRRRGPLRGADGVRRRSE